MPDDDQRRWVWTDGSYMDTSGHGGWAWVDPAGPSASGALEVGISSEFMELKAILEAIANSRDSLLILCDHQGLVRNLNRKGADLRVWAYGQRRGQTRPYLESVIDLMKGRDIEFRWTRGHSTDHLNRQADRMAWRARINYEAECHECVVRKRSTPRVQRQKVPRLSHEEVLGAWSDWRGTS